MKLEGKAKMLRIYFGEMISGRGSRCIVRSSRNAENSTSQARPC